MGKLNRFLDFGSRKLVRSWIHVNTVPDDASAD